MSDTRSHDTPGSEGIDRRSFFRYGAATGIAAAGSGTSWFREAEATPTPLPAKIPEFELEEATITQLQEMMESGRHTARSLVEAYLERIQSLDRQGPALHHVIEANPEALAITDRVDAERKDRGSRGPLHGIPVLVKDNIDTGDRMMTAAGSLALEGAPAPRDAFIIERLRAAGAIILTKANLSEWANFRNAARFDRERRGFPRPFRRRRRSYARAGTPPSITDACIG